MDKAPVIVSIAYELAEMLADETPPENAFTVVEGYRLYIEACERQGKQARGERWYIDSLAQEVRRGALVVQKYRGRNYYWAARGE